jgi:cytoskeletal protein CcmA (bactofilin family)
MFGKKTENASTKQSTPMQQSGINTLVVGTTTEGTINTQSDIRVDGTISGTLHCGGRVIIGQQGVIKGEIYCQNAVVEGTFEGKLEVKETLSVKETAHINGDIHTSKLIVQNGAIFNVNCKMGDQKLKSITDSNKKEFAK